MALSVQLGAHSLIQLGVGISDIAVLMRHGHNWLKTRRYDHELFESIAEVYGEVLRRRGLVDVTFMEHVWATRYNFVYHGETVQQRLHASDDVKSLEGFSWLMVALITTFDLCLTTSLMKSLLADLFVRILHRDDVQELSEALAINLHDNIESWRSTGCIRGLVVPVTNAVRNCRADVTGEMAIPQLNRWERQELLELLVWLLSGDTNQHQSLSATCYSLAAGWKAAGICVDVSPSVNLDTSRPTIYYTQGPGEETRFEHILEMGMELNIGHKQLVPAQHCTFAFGHPEQMIECLPRPIPVKNRIASFWSKGTNAAKNFTFKAIPGSRIQYSPGKVLYDILPQAECTRRWPSATLILAERAFPATDDITCQAIEDLTAGDPSIFHDWLGTNLMYDDSTIGDLSNSFPDAELDLLLCYQALVYGFWYQIVDELLVQDYIQTDILMSGIWGWRETRLLAKLEQLNRTIVKRQPIARVDMIRALAMMFAGRCGKPFESVAEDDVRRQGLMAVLGSISIVSMSLLRIPRLPEDCVKFALVSLPVLDLLGDQNGELFSAARFDGPQITDASPTELIVFKSSPIKTWSVHPKLNYVNGRIEDVSMVARCGGVPVNSFCPDLADIAFLNSIHLHSGLGDDKHSSGPLENRRESDDEDVKVFGVNVTEDDFLNGIIPASSTDQANPYVKVVHSTKSVAMRYAAIGEHCLVGDEMRILYDKCKLRAEIDRLPRSKNGGSHGILIL